MTTVLTEQYAKSAEDPPSGVSPGSLFVSTSLATWTTANPEQFARDFQINDTVYRRLDPKYYAWLRSRMVVAKKAATAGHLPPAAFEDLRVRFNAVHEWAVEHFGETQLLAAVRNLRAGDYKPPVAQDDGPPPRRRARGDPAAIRFRPRRLPWSMGSVSALWRLVGHTNGCMAQAVAAPLIHVVGLFVF